MLRRFALNCGILATSCMLPIGVYAEEGLSKEAMQAVCKAAIAKTMGRDASIMKTKISSSNIIDLYYIRDDGKRFEYNCKIDGNSVIWAGIFDGKRGRWRDLPDDGSLTFEIKNNSITIEEIYSDGSSSSEVYKILSHK